MGWGHFVSVLFIPGKCDGQMHLKAQCMIYIPNKFDLLLAVFSPFLHLQLIKTPCLFSNAGPLDLKEISEVMRKQMPTYLTMGYISAIFL